MIANLNLMFKAVFIRGLPGTLTKLLPHVVRGLPTAVPAVEKTVNVKRAVSAGLTLYRRKSR